MIELFRGILFECVQNYDSDNTRFGPAQLDFEDWVEFGLSFQILKSPNCLFSTLLFFLYVFSVKAE